MNRIDCFIPYVNDEQVAVTLANLNSETEVARVIPLDASSFKSTASIKEVASKAEAPFVLLYTKTTDLKVLFGTNYRRR